MLRGIYSNKRKTVILYSLIADPNQNNFQFHAVDLHGDILFSDKMPQTSDYSSLATSIILLPTINLLNTILAIIYSSTFD